LIVLNLVPLINISTFVWFSVERKEGGVVVTWSPVARDGPPPAYDAPSAALAPAGAPLRTRATNTVRFRGGGRAGAHGVCKLVTFAAPRPGRMAGRGIATPRRPNESGPAPAISMYIYFDRRVHWNVRTSFYRFGRPNTFRRKIVL
jgi:hypothetical protein